LISDNKRTVTKIKAAVPISPNIFLKKWKKLISAFSTITKSFGKAPEKFGTFADGYEYKMPELRTGF